MGRLAPLAVLVAAGAAWGLATPLMRVTVSTGYRPLGLLAWQALIMALVLGLVLRLRGRPFGLSRRNLPVFVLVALFGSLLPGYFSFLTAGLLPAGVRSVILSSVPLFVLPLALAMGMERPAAGRALGLLLGAAALLLLAGPRGDAALAPAAVLLAAIAPLSYAIEASYLAWRGPTGLDPFQLLFGSSLAGFAGALPLALASGQGLGIVSGWGAPESAFVGSVLLNAAAYAGYVWLIGRAGPVFASQIAYLITGFGILWSMVLLGERYGADVWAALALMLSGLALVRPAVESD